MALFARTTARNIIKQPRFYVTDTALEKLWEPLKVPAYQDPSIALQKRIADLGKKSGLEVREGDAYEGKGALFPNPFKVVDLDAMGVYGHLNNVTDADIARIETDNAEAQVLLRSKFYSADGKQTADQKKKMTAFLEANPKYNQINVSFIKKGRETLRKIMKHGGHFNKAHFASVELKFFNPAVWGKGKGFNYIDPDYIACEPPRPGKRGRWIIIELKKGWGKTDTAAAAAEAQQLRKAAALVRKWSLEIWGQVPIVELYFAAGEASDFGGLYEFTREGGRNLNTKNVTNSNMRNANGKVIPKYVATPINLLTGKGFANLIRVEPVTMAQITTGQTKAYSQGPFAPAAEYLDEKYGTAESFRTISLRKDPGFINIVPRHWVPRELVKELGHVPANKKEQKFNYDATVRKVAKLLGYIKARKMDIKNEKKVQKDKYRKEVLQVTKALLARYRPILSQSVVRKLESNRNNLSKKVAVPTNKTPNMGPKFLSKILRRRLDFKVERGKPTRLRNIEFTAASVAPGHMIRENVWKPLKGAAPPIPKAPSPAKAKVPSPVMTNKELEAKITEVIFRAGKAYERRMWANMMAAKKEASPLLRKAATRTGLANFTNQARNALANLQSNAAPSPVRKTAAASARPKANANKQVFKKAYQQQFGNAFDLRKIGAYEKRVGQSVQQLAASIRAGTPLVR